MRQSRKSAHASQTCFRDGMNSTCPKWRPDGAKDQSRANAMTVCAEPSLIRCRAFCISQEPTLRQTALSDDNMILDSEVVELFQEIEEADKQTFLDVLWILLHADAASITRGPCVGKL